jgi:hypothetical protein
MRYQYLHMRQDNFNRAYLMRNPVIRLHIPECSVHKKAAKQLQMTFGGIMSFWTGDAMLLDQSLHWK